MEGEMTVHPLTNPTTVSGVLVAGIRSLCGWAACESTGKAAAKFILRDGKDSTGIMLLPVTLSAEQSTREFLGQEAIPVTSGSLYLEMIAGSIEGQVTTL